MLRKDLANFLLDQPSTVRQLARQFRQQPGDVLNDLEHMARSLKHLGYQLIVDPAKCQKCGFQFRTTTLNKPSRCPECHSTYVTEPLISTHRTEETSKDTA